LPKLRFQPEVAHQDNLVSDGPTKPHVYEAFNIINN